MHFYHVSFITIHEKTNQMLENKTNAATVEVVFFSNKWRWTTSYSMLHNITNAVTTEAVFLKQMTMHYELQHITTMFSHRNARQQTDQLKFLRAIF